MGIVFWNTLLFDAVLRIRSYRILLGRQIYESAVRCIFSNRYVTYFEAARAVGFDRIYQYRLGHGQICSIVYSIPCFI